MLSQLDVLNKAIGAGCQLVDLELQSAVKCKPAQIEKLRAHASLILSFHDFKATKKLEETLAKMSAIPADYYKVVSTATTLYDNVTMMKFLEKHGDRQSLVGMCMGEQGIISRVLACGRVARLLLLGQRSRKNCARPGDFAGIAWHLSH